MSTSPSRRIDKPSRAQAQWLVNIAYKQRHEMTSLAIGGTFAFGHQQHEDAI